MRTVISGATVLEVTPPAYGTWQLGGDWGPVDERSAVAAISHARSLGGAGRDARARAAAKPVRAGTAEGRAG